MMNGGKKHPERDSEACASGFLCETERALSLGCAAASPQDFLSLESESDASARTEAEVCRQKQMAVQNAAFDARVEQRGEDDIFDRLL